ncbi:DNA-binding protein [Pseudomonas daroniae]|uniref:DNA-binding protein n=1 Tax=Phytopseudomonas daroniae TaxID=2487519 RepID=A0A4Q9QQ09_9GAMM|nr:MULTISPECIES: XRE family transcriptional regulator [Pseudomonas]TBU82763.1 DNA-binding protein [Pseudomonas daroniae]TBU86037.1 DNA-binding protein [Pseudomonas sp. FRB 228]TBU95200.1 DNA-binding protein [Pseudomonas daroniae]
MEKTRQKFAARLRTALSNAGYAPKPAVLEREFNLRYWGRPVTLHGVRRWLKGETLPTQDKLLVLAEWLNIDPRTLRFGEEVSERIDNQKQRHELLLNQEREIINAFLGLSETRRKLIRDLITTCVQAERSQAHLLNERLAHNTQERGEGDD